MGYPRKGGHHSEQRPPARVSSLSHKHLQEKNKGKTRPGTQRRKKKERKGKNFTHLETEVILKDFVPKKNTRKERKNKGKEMKARKPGNQKSCL